MLCSACQDIFKKPEFIENKILYAVGKYKHATYTRSVREAALVDGCQICAMLCLHFGEGDPEKRPTEDLDLEYGIDVIEKDPSKSEHEVTADSHLSIRFIYKNQSRGYTITVLFIEEEKDVASLICKDPDLLPRSTSSGESTSSWAQASTWMNECLESHTQCNSIVNDGPWWPTRLLKVRDVDGITNIQLIETKDVNPSGAYITLSHRWGEAEFIKLLKENLAELKAGISTDDLPQTFRDAIDVTRRFKIPYLWIDSLCIIQDSIEDWNKEASQMSEVYQHAICNVAATGAVDSTKGLFFDNNLHTVRPCKVQIPVRGSLKFKDVYVMDPDFWEYRIQGAPLIRRAWVVQERLLARRVLHFNRDQLYWECRERSACEIFPDKMPEIMMRHGSFKDIVPNTELHEVASKNSINPWRSREMIWARVLSSYSMAQLSNPEDKEAALSGILRMLEGIFDDTYIAGLWRKGLPAQLVWQTIKPGKPSPQYRAPSWSWLSIDGEVDAHRSAVIRETDRDTFLEVACAELEDIEITRAGESALSPITSGFIRLRGMLIPVTWQHEYGDHTTIVLEIEGKKDLHMYGDFDDVSFTVDSAGWVMQIAACRMSGELFGDGLILQRNPDGIFRRIGSFSSAYEGTRHLLPKRHREMMAGEKDLGTLFSGLSVLPNPQDQLTQEKAEQDSEEQSIIII